MVVELPMEHVPLYDTKEEYLENMYEADAERKPVTMSGVQRRSLSSMRQGKRMIMNKWWPGY